MAEDVVVSLVWLRRTIHVHITNHWSSYTRFAWAVLAAQAAVLPERLDGGQPQRMHDIE
jgi:hypothetical protein